MNRIFWIFLAVFLTTSTLLAQDSVNMKLKVFIEGQIIDFDYLRNNITFVDFVNDPHTSDVQIIVTRKETGSGGKHFYISYNPVTFKSVENLVLNCITSYHDTQDDVRKKFTESIKSGLLVFTNEKQLYYQVNVVENKALNDSGSTNIDKPDSWNNWIFNIGLNGGLDAEEQKNNFEYEIYFEANRITDIWRIRNEYSFAREETFITKKEDSAKRVIHAYNQEQEFNSRLAYSLSSHWSVGFFLKGNQTSYRNIQFNGSLSTAVEYNFYPWHQVSRRIFTIGYYSGPSYFDYYKPTIFEKTSELLWEENIYLNLEKVEKWGELEMWLEAGHFFPGFDFYSLKSGIEISVRVFKGLFLEFNFEAEIIKNQLYIQVSELTDEELLLNIRKLPTSFEFSGDIGIRYQFGSIYNNIVNQRL